MDTSPPTRPTAAAGPGKKPLVPAAVLLGTDRASSSASSSAGSPRQRASRWNRSAPRSSNAMRMLIGPIVFLTIVGGIASVADLKKVGMTGLKALTYFQVGTIFALIFGLVAINIFRLGEGVNADASTIKTSDSAGQADRRRRAPGMVGVPHPHHPQQHRRALRRGRHPPDHLHRRGLRHRPERHGQGRRARPGRRAAPDRGHVQDPGLHHEGRPDRRVRRDGLRRRQVRRLLPDQHGRADRALLRHLDPLRRRGPRLGHGLPEAEHLHDDPPPQRGILLILGTSTAEPALPGPDAQARARRREEGNRRPRRPHRLQLQPRRRRHLPFPGRRLHRPGHQHEPDHRPATGPASPSCC